MNSATGDAGSEKEPMHVGRDFRWQLTFWSPHDLYLNWTNLLNLVERRPAS